MELQKVFQKLGYIGAKGYAILDALLRNCIVSCHSWSVSKSIAVRRIKRKIKNKIKKWKVFNMANKRMIVQGIADKVEAVNKQFAEKDKAKNTEEYKYLRALTSVAQAEEMKVSINEIWEQGLVCVQVTLEGVDY